MRRVVTKRGGREIRSHGWRCLLPFGTTLSATSLRSARTRCRSIARGELRLEHSIRGGSITIVERRPPWSALVGPEWTSMKIAQLRYDERSRTWALYASDRNERWFLHDTEPAPDVVPLLAEIAEDSTGIFWG